MSVIIDNEEYDFIHNPNYGNYLPTIQAPKVTFVADSGYVHQREAYPVHAKKISLEWQLISRAQINMLKAWISYIGSQTFWYVIPTSLKPRPDGRIIPKGILCRITDTEIPEDPTYYELYHAKITIESIGGEWEPDKWTVTGSVTLANATLDLEDGIAFVDFNAAHILTDYATPFGKLTITGKTTGKKAIGYIGSITGYTDVIPTMTSNTAPSGEASASTILNASYDAWKAFDKVISGEHVWVTEENVTSGWLAYEFASAKDIVKYEITPYYTTPETAPKDWHLVDLTGVVLDTRVNQIWTAGTKKVFYPTKVGSSTKYKLNISANGGYSHYLVLAELKLFELATRPIGVNITSTPGGTIRNWASIEDDFDPNDAAGFDYEIEWYE